MNDTHEDIRRNLLVFSSAVLIYAWLGMPDLVFLKKLLDLDSAQVDPIRFTVAAMFIQGYLNLRYRFSPASAKAEAAFQGDLAHVRQRWITRALKRGLNDFNKSGKQPAYYVTDLNDYVANELKRDRPLSSGDEEEGEEPPLSPAETEGPIKVTLDYVAHVSGSDYWTGQVQVTRSYSTTRRIGTSAGGLQLQYSFSRRDRLGMTARLAPRLAYTHFAVEYAIPVAVASLSTAVLLVRLVRGIF